MAPEYALWGYLTEKADVYSFGVVALEIVSGRSNRSYMPKSEGVCLLDWVSFHHHITSLSILGHQYSNILLGIGLYSATKRSYNGDSGSKFGV